MPGSKAPFNTEIHQVQHIVVMPLTNAEKTCRVEMEGSDHAEFNSVVETKRAILKPIYRTDSSMPWTIRYKSLHFTLSYFLSRNIENLASYILDPRLKSLHSFKCRPLYVTGSAVELAICS